MLISDVMIFPIIFLIDQKAGIVNKYPFIRWQNSIYIIAPNNPKQKYFSSWMENMKASSSCESVMLELLSSSDLGLASSASRLASLPPASVPDESLYKCDPARKPQSAKTYTRQADINQVLTRESYEHCIVKP